MLRWLLFLSLLVSCPVYAATLVSADGVVRLFDKPCTARSVLERFTVVHGAELRAGALTLNGKTIDACWIAGRTMVFLIDSEGDLSRVPLENFKAS